MNCVVCKKDVPKLEAAKYLSRSTEGPFCGPSCRAVWDSWTDAARVVAHLTPEELARLEFLSWRLKHDAVRS